MTQFYIEKKAAIPRKITYIAVLASAMFFSVSKRASAQTASTASEELNGWLQLAINVLSAVAGLAFVISFIFAGYQYMTARDDANQVKSAKERLTTLVLTFVVFAFGYALLQWLVPGGIFD